MLTAFLPYILLLAGFAILIKGSDILVTGAAALAKRYHASELAIGLTVVAFGTSTPELVVNLLAAHQGHTAIAFGNVVGSNIANILLILGISALVFPLTVSRGTVWKEIPFSFLAALVLGIMGYDRLFAKAPNLIGRGDGLVLLCFFVIFLYYTASIASVSEIEDLDQQTPKRHLSLSAAGGYVMLGLVLLVLGGWLIVQNAVLIARNLGLSESVIGLTVVAVGTSLPELATSVAAALRKHADIAVGNVVGSNIFNVFFIFGLTSVVHPVPILESSAMDLLVLLIASAFLFAFMFSGRRHRIDRWEGGLFICGYMAYIGFKLLVPE